MRFRAVAAFFPAATRFGDFRAVAFRAVVRFRVVEALRPAVFLAVVLRLRVAAAFFAAATRFGDFRVAGLRAVVRFLAVAFRAVVRFRVVAALRAAVLRVVVVRFLVVAAFFAAATRFGDFRAVAFFATVRFRAVAALRAGDFRDATLRFRVAAFVLAAVAAFRAVVDLRVVAGRVIASSMGPPIPAGMVSDRGVGRSHAGVSALHNGSGALDGAGVLGASWVLVSSTSFVCSVIPDAGSSASSRRARSCG